MDLIASQLVIVFVLIVFSSYLIKTTNKLDGHYRLLFGLSGIGYISTLILGFVYSFIPVEHDLFYSRILEWVRISSVVLMLCALGVMVRYAKPKITRAPTILSFLPVLLLFVHPFVVDTLILKDVLINFYHGGGLLIALMMYTIKTQINSKYYIILSGVAIITIGYTLNFFGWNVVSISNLVIGTGLYVVLKGYRQLGINS
jgi:hypothetical protein